MHRLRPGHPSSPWDADGTERPPAPNLADYALADRPMSDADYSVHVREVTAALDKASAAGLTTERLHTVNDDHDIWTEDRAARQDEIIEEVYTAANGVPCERQAIIAGGLAGAGKTTILEQHAGIDRSQYLTINPDQFKEKLAERGLLPDVPGLSPMEASALAHQESSYLGRQLALRAMADGKNIIWDITMSSVESTERRADDLRAAGYQRVEAIFVDIPVEVSIARAEARHRRGHDDYLAGQSLGGRYIREDITMSQADPEYGSVNRRAFETLKHSFDGWARYDNSVDGGPPFLVESSPGWPVYPGSEAGRVDREGNR